MSHAIKIISNAIKVRKFIADINDEEVTKDTIFSILKKKSNDMNQGKGPEDQHNFYNPQELTEVSQFLQSMAEGSIPKDKIDREQLEMLRENPEIIEFTINNVAELQQHFNGLLEI